MGEFDKAPMNDKNKAREILEHLRVDNPSIENFLAK
jgi:hypothetical protein